MKGFSRERNEVGKTLKGKQEANRNCRRESTFLSMYPEIVKIRV
jgi:hypothetical protein